MHFNFQLMQDHLRVELFGRKTAEETLEFVQALVAEVRASHQYIEVLASQQGAKVRAFRDEPRALNWLSVDSGTENSGTEP